MAVTVSGSNPDCIPSKFQAVVRRLHPPLLVLPVLGVSFDRWKPRWPWSRYGALIRDN